MNFLYLLVIYYIIGFTHIAVENINIVLHNYHQKWYINILAGVCW